MTAIQAHRGASEVAPENTLAAFRQAVRMGTDGIECDIHATKDGVYVVCHDDTIDRTSNGSGRIAEKTYAELCHYDFGSWKDMQFAGEKLPTLEQMLEVVGGLRIINIEVKDLRDNTREDIEAFYAILTRHGVVDRVLVSSFRLEILKDLKRYYPNLRTAYLYVDAADKAAMEAAVDSGCFAIHPSGGNLTPELVDEAHRKGLAVNVWTIDNEEEMRRLAGWGCDGLITNRPEAALRVLGR